MWTSVYMAQSLDIANNIREKIEKSGIIVMLKKMRSHDNAADTCYELLVPYAEHEAALEIIIDN